MEEKFHELNPDGDVLLILQNPDAAFAVWDDGFPEREPRYRKKKGKKSKRKLRVKPSSEPLEVDSSNYQDQLLAAGESSLRDQQSNPSRTSTPPHSGSDEILMPLAEQGGVQIRVSSSHLILASPYFKRMLKGGWKEGQTLRSDGCVPLYVKEWDPDALLILMSIIHGRTRKVPRSVDLEMLTKIAVLVDYYECFEVVEVFSEMWINQLKEDLPGTYCRDLVLWMCISWVFRQPKQFETAAKIALVQSKGPIQTLGLPISERIVQNIDRQRQESIDRIVTSLHDLLADFREGEDSCSFECDSMLLGALTKEMHVRCLFSPRPVMPFLGLSFAETIESVRDVRSPSWASPDERRYDEYQQHDCSLEPRVRPIVDSIEDNIKGLTLEDLSMPEIKQQEV